MILIIRVRVWIGVIYFLKKNSGSPIISYVEKWIRDWTTNLKVKSSNPVQVSKKKNKWMILLGGRYNSRW